MGPRCCLYQTSIKREGLPNCGDCKVAESYNSMDTENLDAFNLFHQYLGTAYVNPFPMAEKPVLMLDMGTVRLCLEAEQVPREEWPDMITKFKILFDAREHTRA